MSAKQSVAWALFQHGLSQVEITRKLKTTRQYVNQTLRLSETKIARSLLDTARLSGLEVKKAHPEKGILLGYHPVLKRNVIVTYTTRNGLRVWYWYDRPEEVKDEKLLAEAREYLLNEAKERGIDLGNDERKLHPAKLARRIFTELISGAKA